MPHLTNKAKAIIAALITAAATVSLTLGADPTVVGLVTTFLVALGVYTVPNTK